MFQGKGNDLVLGAGGWATVWGIIRGTTDNIITHMFSPWLYQSVPWPLPSPKPLEDIDKK